jgi:hypothetical protein
MSIVERILLVFWRENNQGAFDIACYREVGLRFDLHWLGRTCIF